jgi:deazaflavin-dependent oxidoreductase (nitroreductase family)
MSRTRTTVVVFCALAALCLVPPAVLVVGIRSGNRRFIRALTAFQRDVVNPRALESAGKPGSAHAIIEHVGRTSGAAYATPVGPVRDGAGWVISLPYGEQASWVRNVMAAGEAQLIVDGTRRRVTHPEVVPISSTPMIRNDAFAIRLFGIRSAMRLDDAEG